MPAGAEDAEKWTRADVTVEALRDRHLVGPSVPIAYDTRGLRNVQYALRRRRVVTRMLARGDEYTAWGFAPRPKPSALAKSPAVYPYHFGAGHYQTVERGTRLRSSAIPAGSSGQTRLRLDRSLRAYEPLYERARAHRRRRTQPVRGDGRPRGLVPDRRRVHVRREPSENAAWRAAARLLPGGVEGRLLPALRGRDGPRAPLSRDPVTRRRRVHERIYDRERRVWNVSDRNAHTWVEVWFRGFGWLPFDPTPGRGNLSGPYSASSFSLRRPGAKAVLAASGPRRPGSADSLLRFQLARGQDTSSSATPRDLRPSGEQGGEGGGGIGRGAIFMLVLLGLAFALVLGKLALRRSRYLTRDPRRLAGAYRQELVEFLADQRVVVPASATLAEVRELVAARTGVDARRLRRVARHSPVRPGSRRPPPRRSARGASCASSGDACAGRSRPASGCAARSPFGRSSPGSGGDRDGGRGRPSPSADHRTVAEAGAADRRAGRRRRPSCTSSPRAGVSGPGSSPGTWPSRSRSSSRLPSLRLEVRFVRQPEPLGSADAVSRALAAGAELPCLVSAADTVYAPGDVARLTGSVEAAVAWRKAPPGAAVEIEDGRVRRVPGAGEHFAAPLWVLTAQVAEHLEGLPGPPFELAGRLSAGDRGGHDRGWSRDRADAGPDRAGRSRAAQLSLSWKR